MTDPTGPLDELRENLTGAAAGDFSPRLGEDDIVATQTPTDADVSPLSRQVDPEDKPDVRPEDEDGAPEL